MATVSIFMMIGMLSLAVDLGWGYFRRDAAQTAADAAASAVVQAAMVIRKFADLRLEQSVVRFARGDGHQLPRDRSGYRVYEFRQRLHTGFGQRIRHQR